MKKHVSISEASTMTGYSKSKLRRWCKGGGIMYVRPGGERGMYLIEIENNNIKFSVKEESHGQ